MIWQDQTGASVQFVMDALPKGDYYLKVIPPSGYYFTRPNQGSNELLESDVDASNEQSTTSYFRVSPGQNLPDVDAGLVQGVLVAEFILVEGIHKEDHNAITWEVGSEVNADCYFIERKFETDQTFQTIGEVKVRGNALDRQEYTFDDFDIALRGQYLYRIRLLDQDGSVTMSRIISIAETASKNNDLRLYPNPSNDIVVLSLDIASRSNVSVDIFDDKGRVVKRNVIHQSYDVGPYEKKIDVRRLTPGLYV